MSGVPDAFTTQVSPCAWAGQEIEELVEKVLQGRGYPALTMSRDEQNRPVLVAGGAGYIGSHTVRALEKLGTPVVVLDDLSAGHREALKAPLEVCGLGDREGLARVFEKHNPRSVIHFAAKCYVGESVEDPAKYYEHNVTYTWNLLQAMRAADCRNIVFSSSCATYGDPVEIPMTDGHPQKPISPYGRTKLHMEHMIEDFAHAYDLHYAALRYFNAAGASQEGDLGEDHDPETHLIPLILQVALGQRDEIKIFGDDYDTPDGTCIRDYIHIEDLASAHIAALNKLEAGTARIACNLGTGTGFSVREVIEMAREVTGHAIPATITPRRPGDPPQLISGGTLAKADLGWEPQRPDLRDIVSDAWQFLKAHPNGYSGSSDC
ncbi:MAG: UDP-glucose 4-epimerase [Planctomycetota bacterium]|jgi:UDP-glucose 4-epimerase